MKGQQSIVAIMILVTGITGFGAIMSSDEKITAEIEHNTGDFNTVTRTKLKVEAFESRAPKEVNFTINNMSTTKIEWRNEPPNIEDAKSNYLAELNSILEDQLSILGCSGPGVESIELGESLTEYTVSLTGESITCVSEATEVSLPTDLGDSFTVNHPKNRYVGTLNYSSNYSRNLKNRLDGIDDLSADGGGEASSCLEEENSDVYGDSTPRQYSREEAKSSAISNLESNIESNATEERSDGDELSTDWVGINIDSVRVHGSCSFDTSSSSESCGDDDDASSGTSYSSECTFTASEASIEFSIEDSEHEIVTANGEVNPEFKWNYTYVD